MAVTLFAGALWGRLSWGTFWVWDARVTTTRSCSSRMSATSRCATSAGSHQQRARRSAVVALLAVLEIPLVHFSVKLWRSVHQDASVGDRTSDVTLDGLMLFTLMLALVAFSLLYAWWVLHRHACSRCATPSTTRGLDLALVERRRESSAS
jgi:heme exporter protein C